LNGYTQKGVNLSRPIISPETIPALEPGLIPQNIQLRLEISLLFADNKCRFSVDLEEGILINPEVVAAFPAASNRAD